MKKYKLTIAYDGTNFGGWQIQPNAESIQEHLQKALTTILREEIHVSGSGRTDAGVHALAQVAHFKTSQEIEPQRIQHSLNGILPKTIRIRSLELAPDDFHARFSAKRKIYHYHLHTSQTQSPFNRLYRTHIRHELNIDTIKLATTHLIGTHDFTSFANEGGAKTNPNKTLYSINIVPETEGLRLEFEGNGFLYKMVRNIVGTLLDTATGKLNPNDIPAILETKDRKRASQAAPPQGLFLIKVIY